MALRMIRCIEVTLARACGSNSYLFLQSLVSRPDRMLFETSESRDGNLTSSCCDTTIEDLIMMIKLRGRYEYFGQMPKAFKTKTRETEGIY